MKQPIVTIYQQMGIMLRFFDNVLGEVRTSFVKLEPVREVDAESLFQAINKKCCDPSLINWLVWGQTEQMS